MNLRLVRIAMLMQLANHTLGLEPIGCENVLDADRLCYGESCITAMHYLLYCLHAELPFYQGFEGLSPLRHVNYV